MRYKQLRSACCPSNLFVPAHFIRGRIIARCRSSGVSKDIQWLFRIPSDSHSIHVVDKRERNLGSVHTRLPSYLHTAYKDFCA